MSDPTTTNVLSKREEEGLTSSLGLSSVDLMAMVLSDSGLANAEPKWWNASPIGCFLIGLQPRGGWQIMQRSMQWGNDALARCFGVDCQSPTLYAYFACSIRNRLEVLNSERFRSPMEGQLPGAPWNTTSSFTVKRPTKLIDGSRGGQAFIAEILVPEGNKHYSIADQSRLQLISVLLVGAGLTHENMVDRYIDEVVPADFDMSPGLGSVFIRLAIGLAVTSLACVGMLFITWSSILGNRNFLRGALPWITKILSLSCWAVGAIGLLMLGGNPRVRVIVKKPDGHVARRLKQLDPTTKRIDTETSQPFTVESEGDVKYTITSSTQDDRILVEMTRAEKSLDVMTEMKDTMEATMTRIDSNTDSFITRSTRSRTMVKVQFGSLHGSIFTPDRGYCHLPLPLVEKICALDIKTVRSWGWVLGAVWFALMLLAGVTLQIGGALRPSFGADLMSLTFLLLTSLARGAGVSGPEDWMIPKWKRRPNTKNGAILLGQYSARTGGDNV